MDLGQAGVVAVPFGLEVRSRLLEKPLGGCCPLVGRLHRRLPLRHLDLQAAQRCLCFRSALRRLASGLLGAGRSVVGGFGPGLGGRRRRSALIQLLGKPAGLLLVGGGRPGCQMVALIELGTMSGEGRFQGVLSRGRRAVSAGSAPPTPSR